MHLCHRFKAGCC